MLDFGWTELFLIMAVAVMVIGPKELPALMHGLGRIVRRLQYMKFALSQQFDDFMNEADMKDLGRGVNFEAPKDSTVFDEAAEDEDPAYIIDADPADVVADDDEEDEDALVHYSPEEAEEHSLDDEALSPEKVEGKP